MIKKDDLPFGLDDTVFQFLCQDEQLLIVELKLRKILVDKKSNLYELLFLDLERQEPNPTQFTSLVMNYGTDYVITRHGYIFSNLSAAESHRDAMLL